MTQLPPEIPPPAPPPENQKKGLAIAGLVLGNLAIVVPLVGSLFFGLLALPIAGVLLAMGGVILSALAVSRRTAGRGMAVTGLVLSIGVLLVVGLLLSIIAPYLLNSRDVNKAAGCGMNLSNLGKAIMVYKANYNDEHFPPNLDVLFRDGELPDAMLQCPAEASSSGSSYFYCAPLDGDSNTIVACDVAPVHRGPNGQRNYLRSDLSVQRATELDFQQRLQEPQNRRFAKEFAKAMKMTPRERVTYIAPRGDE